MVGVLLVLLVGVAGAAGVAAYRLRQRLVEAEAAIEALRVELAADVVPPGPHVITIEMRNISELAVQRSTIAWPLATFAPGVLRTIVLRQTVREMRTQMAAEGVDADVQIRRLPAVATPAPIEAESATLVP